MELEPRQFADRLVSGMSDAMIYADAEGVIRLWNRGATRVFGFAEAEALGCSLDIIIPESLRERHWQGYRATMHTGQSRYGGGEKRTVCLRPRRLASFIALCRAPFVCGSSLYLIDMVRISIGASGNP
jgi:PAS domain-containing protein